MYTISRGEWLETGRAGYLRADFSCAAWAQRLAESSSPCRSKAMGCASCLVLIRAACHGADDGMASPHHKARHTDADMLRAMMALTMVRPHDPPRRTWHCMPGTSSTGSSTSPSWAGGWVGGRGMDQLRPRNGRPWTAIRVDGCNGLRLGAWTRATATSHHAKVDRDDCVLSATARRCMDP